MRKAVIILLLPLCLFTAGLKKEPRTRPYPFPRLPYFPPMPETPGNPVTIEGVRLGRYLFYDPILSADSSMSCASCHRQEAAFSDASFARSKDREGKPLPRNTPPLFNLAWYPKLFWDGRAASLEEQVLHPLRAHEEMNLNWSNAALRLQRSKRYPQLFKAAFGAMEIDSNLIARAIAQFERTLLSYRSKYDRVLAGADKFSSDEYEGFEIVNDMSMGDCLHCHSTDNDALGVQPRFSNNGLDTATTAKDFRDPGYGAVTGRESDFGKFKIPTLRNVALTPPYMHDGRFKTLEEVLLFYSKGVRLSPTLDSHMEAAHKGGVHLNAEQRRKVIAFLRTLTDSAFITDPEFSNPFVDQNSDEVQRHSH